MNQPSHNPQRFTNKVVIVTGAAQGIGQGVALQVAAEGGLVVLVDRSDYLDQVHQEIIAAGQTAPPLSYRRAQTAPCGGNGSCDWK